MDFKRCERRFGDDWLKVEFEDIRPGDTFRIWRQEDVHQWLFEAVCLSMPVPCDPPGNWIFDAKVIREMRGEVRL